MNQKETHETCSRLLAQISAVRVLVVALLAQSDNQIQVRAAINKYAEVIRSVIVASTMPEVAIAEFDQVLEATIRLLPKLH